MKNNNPQSPTLDDMFSGPGAPRGNNPMPGIPGNRPRLPNSAANPPNSNPPPSFRVTPPNQRGGPGMTSRLPSNNPSPKDATMNLPKPNGQFKNPPSRTPMEPPLGPPPLNSRAPMMNTSRTPREPPINDPVMPGSLPNHSQASSFSAAPTARPMASGAKTPRQSSMPMPRDGLPTVSGPPTGRIPPPIMQTNGNSRIPPPVNNGNNTNTNDPDPLATPLFSSRDRAPPAHGILKTPKTSPPEEEEFHLPDLRSHTSSSPDPGSKGYDRSQLARSRPASPTRSQFGRSRPPSPTRSQFGRSRPPSPTRSQYARSRPSSPPGVGPGRLKSRAPSPEFGNELNQRLRSQAPSQGDALGREPRRSLQSRPASPENRPAGRYSHLSRPPSPGHASRSQYASSQYAPSQPPSPRQLAGVSRPASPRQFSASRPPSPGGRNNHYPQPGINEHDGLEAPDDWEAIEAGAEGVDEAGYPIGGFGGPLENEEEYNQELMRMMNMEAETEAGDENDPDGHNDDPSRPQARRSGSLHLYSKSQSLPFYYDENPETPPTQFNRRAPGETQFVPRTRPPRQSRPEQPEESVSLPRTSHRKRFKNFDAKSFFQLKAKRYDAPDVDQMIPVMLKPGEWVYEPAAKADNHVMKAGLHTKPGMDITIEEGPGLPREEEVESPRSEDDYKQALRELEEQLEREKELLERKRNALHPPPPTLERNEAIRPPPRIGYSSEVNRGPAPLSPENVGWNAPPPAGPPRRSPRREPEMPQQPPPPMREPPFQREPRIQRPPPLGRGISRNNPPPNIPISHPPPRPSDVPRRAPPFRDPHPHPQFTPRSMPEPPPLQPRQPRRPHQPPVVRQEPVVSPPPKREPAPVFVRTPAQSRPGPEPEPRSSWPQPPRPAPQRQPEESEYYYYPSDDEIQDEPPETELGEHDMDRIFFSDDRDSPHYELSNLWPGAIEIQGRSFPNAKCLFDYSRDGTDPKTPRTPKSADQNMRESSGGLKSDASASNPNLQRKRSTTSFPSKSPYSTTLDQADSQARPGLSHRPSQMQLQLYSPSSQSGKGAGYTLSGGLAAAAAARKDQEDPRAQVVLANGVPGGPIRAGDEDLMRAVIALKFMTPSLKRYLLNTGETFLIYDSDDSGWGYGRHGEGKNLLGELLMEVRERVTIEREEGRGDVIKAVVDLLAKATLPSKREGPEPPKADREEEARSEMAPDPARSRGVPTAVSADAGVKKMPVTPPARSHATPPTKGVDKPSESPSRNDSKTTNLLNWIQGISGGAPANTNPGIPRSPPAQPMPLPQRNPAARRSYDDDEITLRRKNLSGPSPSTVMPPSTALGPSQGNDATMNRSQPAQSLSLPTSGAGRGVARGPSKPPLSRPSQSALRRASSRDTIRGGITPAHSEHEFDMMDDVSVPGGWRSQAESRAPSQAPSPETKHALVPFNPADPRHTNGAPRTQSFDAQRPEQRRPNLPLSSISNNQNNLARTQSLDTTKRLENARAAPPHMLVSNNQNNPPAHPSLSRKPSRATELSQGTTAPPPSVTSAIPQKTGAKTPRTLGQTLNLTDIDELRAALLAAPAKSGPSGASSAPFFNRTADRPQFQQGLRSEAVSTVPSPREDFYDDSPYLDDEQDDYLPPPPSRGNTWGPSTGKGRGGGRRPPPFA